MQIGKKLGQEVSKEKKAVLIFVTEEDMGHQQVGLRLLKFQIF